MQRLGGTWAWLVVLCGLSACKKSEPETDTATKKPAPVKELTEADVVGSMNFTVAKKGADAATDKTLEGVSLGFSAETFRDRWNEAVKKHGLSNAEQAKLPDSTTSMLGLRTVSIDVVKKKLSAGAMVNAYDNSVRSVVVVVHSTSEEESVMAGKAIIAALDSVAFSDVVADRKALLDKLGLTKKEPVESAAVVVKGKRFAVSRSLGSGVEFEISSVPTLPDDPAGGVGVVAPPGTVGGLGRMPTFAMVRLKDDGSRSFIAAAQACYDAGLSLCSDAQWQRVCALDDALSKVNTWTMTPASGYAKIQTRGGGKGCESGDESAPADISATRAGLCCSYAPGVTGTNSAFDWLRATPAFDYEDALNRRDRTALTESLDDTIEQFFTLTDVPRDDVVKSAMSYMSGQKGMWAHSAQCSLGTVAEMTALDCTRLTVRDDKFMWVGSRYLMSTKHPTKLAAVIDLKVYRPMGK